MTARAYETGHTSKPETSALLLRAYMLHAGFTSQEIDEMSPDDVRIFASTMGAHMKIQSRMIANAVARAFSGD